MVSVINKIFSKGPRQKDKFQKYKEKYNSFKEMKFTPRQRKRKIKFLQTFNGYQSIQIEKFYGIFTC